MTSQNAYFWQNAATEIPYVISSLPLQSCCLLFSFSEKRKRKLYQIDKQLLFIQMSICFFSSTVHIGCVFYRYTTVIPALCIGLCMFLNKNSTKKSSLLYIVLYSVCGKRNAHKTKKKSKIFIKAYFFIAMATTTLVSKSNSFVAIETWRLVNETTRDADAH